MNQIGFTVMKKKAEKEIRPLPSDWVVRFDSDEAITMDDAKRHIGIFGSTGTGKTTTCVYPIVMRHIEAGNACLLIDIKGAMRGKIRAMAKAAGREEDYIEVGTSPSSVHLNIIEGMPASCLNRFLTGLVERSFRGRSNNMDFHQKSIRIATDCFVMLKWLAEKDTAFAPTLPLILEMFVNAQMATRLFESFAKLPDLTDERKQFVAAVNANRFHVLNQTEDILRKAGSSHFEQCNFYTQSINAILRDFLDAPGIIEKFCVPGAPGLDMEKIFDENRICVINFQPMTGRSGAMIGRELLSSAYEAIFQRGVGGRDKLICIDEFQEVADLSDARFSDTSFVGLAREFNCSFVCATQSANALLAVGCSEPAVTAFISNLNTKIFFHTADPVTRLIAQTSAPDLELVDLPPRKAFACWFDGEYRKGIVTMNKMHETTREIVPAKDDELVHPTLSHLVDRMKQEKTETAAATPKSVWLDNLAQHREKLKEEAENARISRSHLQDAFPGLFIERARVSVPVGHMSYVKKVLAYFYDLGLDIRLDVLQIQQTGRVIALSRNSVRDEIVFLNELLQVTERLCVRCGEILPDEWPREPGDEEMISVYSQLDGLHACPDCVRECLPDLRTRIRLSQNQEENEQEEHEEQEDYMCF